MKSSCPAPSPAWPAARQTRESRLVVASIDAIIECEMPDSLHERIVRDPQICGGEPVFQGTRVTLRTVLASLADGDSIEEILADFPSLKADDIRAAISFAAASAEEDLPVPASPEIR
jgi:uncharacterized protein (DUF433 family)